MLATLLLASIPTARASQRGAVVQHSDVFGCALAKVAHLKGIQAPWVTVGAPGDRPLGALYCFGGPEHALRWELTGCSWIGAYLVSIGDVNGDQVTDLLASDGGSIVVLSGANGTLLDLIPCRGEECSTPICVIEGHGELCIIAQVATPVRITVDIRRVVTCISFRSKRLLWQFDGSGLEHLELTSAVGIADIDHDGVQDVLVGYGDDQPPYWMQVSQRVICLSGATGKQLYEVCATPGDRLGYSVAACGDWNDDGVPDFVAGAPRHVLAYGSISAGPGYALVCSGNNGAVLRRLEPESESVGFGYSIASLTGKTAAGPQPILVTAFGDIGEGALYSHSPDDRWPRRGCARGPLTDFGSLVCTIGDQDGDGVEDCAVSSSPWNPDASWDGSVTLISCKDGKELCVLRRPAD